MALSRSSDGSVFPQGRRLSHNQGDHQRNDQSCFTKGHAVPPPPKDLAAPFRKRPQILVLDLSRTAGNPSHLSKDELYRLCL